MKLLLFHFIVKIESELVQMELEEREFFLEELGSERSRPSCSCMMFEVLFVYPLN